MRVSIRENFSSPPSVYDWNWGQICDYYKGWSGVTLQSATPAEKPQDLPLICFGAFDRTDDKGVGCRRGNLNPEGLYCIALDFDDATPEVFTSILEQAKRMSERGLVHTTWKHGLDRVANPNIMGTIRARIVLPCDHSDRPVPVAGWERFWWMVTKAIGASLGTSDTVAVGSGLDTQCRNPERLYYLPCRNPAAPSWAMHLEIW